MNIASIKKTYLGFALFYSFICLSPGIEYSHAMLSSSNQQKSTSEAFKALLADVEKLNTKESALNLLQRDSALISEQDVDHFYLLLKSFQKLKTRVWDLQRELFEYQDIRILENKGIQLLSLTPTQSNTVLLHFFDLFNSILLNNKTKDIDEKNNILGLTSAWIHYVEKYLLYYPNDLTIFQKMGSAELAQNTQQLTIFFEHETEASLSSQFVYGYLQAIKKNKMRIDLSFSPYLDFFKLLISFSDLNDEKMRQEIDSYFSQVPDSFLKSENHALVNLTKDMLTFNEQIEPILVKRSLPHTLQNVSYRNLLNNLLSAIGSRLVHQRSKFTCGDLVNIFYYYRSIGISQSNYQDYPDLVKHLDKIAEETLKIIVRVHLPNNETQSLRFILAQIIHFNPLIGKKTPDDLKDLVYTTATQMIQKTSLTSQSEIKEMNDLIEVIYDFSQKNSSPSKARSYFIEKLGNFYQRFFNQNFNSKTLKPILKWSFFKNNSLGIVISIIAKMNDSEKTKINFGQLNKSISQFLIKFGSEVDFDFFTGALIILKHYGNMSPADFKPITDSIRVSPKSEYLGKPIFMGPLLQIAHILMVQNNIILAPNFISELWNSAQDFRADPALYPNEIIAIASILTAAHLAYPDDTVFSDLFIQVLKLCERINPFSNSSSVSLENKFEYYQFFKFAQTLLSYRVQFTSSQIEKIRHILTPLQTEFPPSYRLANFDRVKSESEIQKTLNKYTHLWKPFVTPPKMNSEVTQDNQKWQEHIFKENCFRSLLVHPTLKIVILVNTAHSTVWETPAVAISIIRSELEQEQRSKRGSGQNSEAVGGWQFYTIQDKDWKSLSNDKSKQLFLEQTIFSNLKERSTSSSHSSIELPSSAETLNQSSHSPQITALNTGVKIEPITIEEVEQVRKHGEDSSDKEKSVSVSIESPSSIDQTLVSANPPIAVNSTEIHDSLTIQNDFASTALTPAFRQLLLHVKYSPDIVIFNRNVGEWLEEHPLEIDAPDYSKLTFELIGGEISSRHLYEITTRYPSLTTIQLKGSSVAGDIFDPLNYLSSLNRFVAIGVKGITWSDLDSLNNLNLEHISFSNTPLDEAGMISLSRLKTLKSLHLKNSGIQDEWIEWINQLEELVELDLAENADLTNIGAALLFSQPKILNRLSLRGAYHWDPISRTRTPLGKLTHLGITYLKSIKTLQALDLSDHPNLGARGVRHFEGLESLERVNLQGTQIKKTDLIQKLLPSTLEQIQFHLTPDSTESNLRLLIAPAQ